MQNKHEADGDTRLSIDQAVRFAIELQQKGQLNKAEGIYQDILAKIPDHQDVLHFYGILEFQRSRTDQAIEKISAAIAAAPDYMDAHNNLGNIYMENRRLEEAEAEYRRTVELAPRHVGALNNLGTVLRALGRFDEAESIFRDTLKDHADFFPLHYNLGNLLYQKGAEEEAVEHYFRAVVLDPDQSRSKIRLGLALIKLGRREEAEQLYRDWLEKEPDNPEAQHMLAACSGEAVPGRASDAYVKTLFNRFADSFEEQLNILAYKAPEFVTGAVATHYGEPENSLAILDAGCGTGLCGPLLKPFAFRLDGVDLSPGMLKKADASGIYDRLTESDLTGYIQGHSGVYDVIVAADVLCYFGDLEDVFAAVADALKPSGRFVFTVERAEPDTNKNNGDYHIIPQGRYTHSEAYIRRIANQKGLTSESITRDVLRKEMGRPVDGLVVTLARA
ncbi:tetratricopeptide repeat protein [Desulfosarcina ovata]|uniref:Uncharacterized protein n=1 Tax=Desulfosarcina ovata subsp. ovata TaxID=2752305 RepID=A0A5K8A8K7_9BACT|nr:tetratricopeptide repeat protein [Desulfosarcina ovata]BBO88768.1 hypothetical protein DSCOOX_19480 [Desulfosarcina ovata subsp. ovata]